MIDLAVKTWLEITTSSSGLSKKQLLELLFSALSAGLTGLSFNLKHTRRYLDAMPHRDESGDKSGQRWGLLECLFIFRYLRAHALPLSLHVSALLCLHDCVRCSESCVRLRYGRRVWVAHASFRHQSPVLMISPYNPFLLVLGCLHLNKQSQSGSLLSGKGQVIAPCDLGGKSIYL